MFAIVMCEAALHFEGLTINKLPDKKDDFERIVERFARKHPEAYFANGEGPTADEADNLGRISPCSLSLIYSTNAYPGNGSKGKALRVLNYFMEFLGQTYLKRSLGDWIGWMILQKLWTRNVNAYFSPFFDSSNPKASYEFPRGMSYIVLHFLYDMEDFLGSEKHETASYEELERRSEAALCNLKNCPSNAEFFKPTKISKNSKRFNPDLHDVAESGIVYRCTCAYPCGTFINHYNEAERARIVIDTDYLVHLWNSHIEHYFPQELIPLAPEAFKAAIPQYEAWLLTHDGPPAEDANSSPSEDTAAAPAAPQFYDSAAALSRSALTIMNIPFDFGDAVRESLLHPALYEDGVHLESFVRVENQSLAFQKSLNVFKPYATRYCASFINAFQCSPALHFTHENLLQLIEENLYSARYIFVNHCRMHHEMATGVSRGVSYIQRDEHSLKLSNELSHYNASIEAFGRLILAPMSPIPCETVTHGKADEEMLKALSVCVKPDPRARCLVYLDEAVKQLK